jgi:iron-sulfur cluster insertion protein
MSESVVLSRPAEIEAGTMPVTLSASAAKRIKEIIASEEDAKAMLRIVVSGGGCSGFQYGFSFDDRQNEDDLVVARDGATLLIDAVSLNYMSGAEVDFVEDLAGAAFQIKNPNATSKCGCGSSFAV